MSQIPQSKLESAQRGSRADESGSYPVGGSPTKRPSANPFPAIRWTETREHVTVIALVPGFTKQDLEVTVKKDLLSIAGRLPPQVPGGYRARHQSRRGSHFLRELKLASDVTWSDTCAQVERGVLTIQLRKDSPSSRASIPIRLT